MDNFTGGTTIVGYSVMTEVDIGDFIDKFAEFVC